ncbi:MAG: hypothetical protein R3308_05405 [Thiohalobacterales bacterium]|nr:hypothetical protein [Thiohalobacterales bacterium]
MPMQARLFSMVLAVVLIAGQLSLALHSHDLESHANGEACKVCMLYAGLDQALAHAHPHTGIQPTDALTEAGRHSINFQYAVIAFLARAPPQDLLYS